MMTLMRVEAVGNAVCAFSKALWAPLCASITPAASIRSVSWLPPPCGFNSPRAFIETAQANRAEVQIPFPIVDRFEPNRFANQDGTHDGGLRVPPHDARRRHAADF